MLIACLGIDFIITLKNIQNFFGSSAGKIYKIKSELLQFRVFSEKDLLKVLKHFEQFPLLTQKKIFFNVTTKE